MVLTHGGKLTKRSDGKWILYLSKKLTDDSAWPFPEGTQDVTVQIHKTQKLLLIWKVEENEQAAK